MKTKYIKCYACVHVYVHVLYLDEFDKLHWALRCTVKHTYNQVPGTGGFASL